MKLRFLGSGDAFGSGGRFMTCFDVSWSGGRFLIDCGASSLVAMKRFGADPNAYRTVFVSHLHGDHFGGLPFFLLDAQFVSRRTEPLTLVGPPAFRDRLHRAMEVLFAGSTRIAWNFPLEIVELEIGAQATIDAVTLTPYEVSHFSGAPSLGFRFEVDGKVLAFSGDTEWCEALIPLGRGADVMICEAYVFEKRVKWHMTVADLLARRGDIGPRRLILTHMADDMLAHETPPDCEKAEDGLVIDI